MHLGPVYLFLLIRADDKSPARWTLGLPYEFLKEQSDDEWINARSQANTSQADKKDSPMTTGGHR